MLQNGSALNGQDMLLSGEELSSKIIILFRFCQENWTKKSNLLLQHSFPQGHFRL